MQSGLLKPALTETEFKCAGQRHGRQLGLGSRRRGDGIGRHGVAPAAAFRSSRFLAFNALPHANEYVMKARGVFAEDAVMRSNPAASGAPAPVRRRGGQITDAHKAEIRTALATYLKPFLVA